MKNENSSEDICQNDLSSISHDVKDVKDVTEKVQSEDQTQTTDNPSETPSSKQLILDIL